MAYEGNPVRYAGDSVPLHQVLASSSQWVVTCIVSSAVSPGHST